MNLSGIASALGGAFSGYGMDQQRRFQQAQLARQMEGTDFDRTLKLREAGFGPVSDVQAALQQAQSAPITQHLTSDSSPTGMPMDPGQLAKSIAANVTKNHQQAQQLQQNIAGAFQVPGQSQQWAQLPFEKTPTGLAIQRAQALEDAKQGRQLATDAAKEQAKAAAAQQAKDRANKAQYGALKAEFGQHPLASKPYDPDTDYASVVTDQRQIRQLQAGQSKEHWVAAGSDPVTGKPLLLNTMTGETKEGGGVRGTVGGAMSAMAQGQQARLLGSVSEARAAMPRMEAMEQKWLDHPETIPNGLGSALAKMGTRFAGSHSLTGIGAETVGEQFADPEVLQYMRDAALMARATQLMSSRGGSEAMVNSEQLLNRAVPRSEGLRQSVSAAQKSRKAIFGEFGGLMQALTPEQIAKVEKGLQMLEKGDQTGASLVGSTLDEARAQQAANPSAAPAPQRRSTDKAATPADRWEQLVRSGLSKEAATAQVKREFPQP